MSIAILRTTHGWYVQTGSGAAPIATSAVTTAELLADREAIATAAAGAHTEPLESLGVLSPVTTPCRVVAQMTNYASHARDAGLNPTALPLTFFRKASGSINGHASRRGKLEHATRPAISDCSIWALVRGNVSQR
jgi:2-keto-4-pentenoate hydratase/2-oxohepta-3-ene-1,7-dioic acid hydratase in catechol pathway